MVKHRPFKSGYESSILSGGTMITSPVSFGKWASLNMVGRGRVATDTSTQLDARDHYLNELERYLWLFNHQNQSQKANQQKY